MSDLGGCRPATSRHIGRHLEALKGTDMIEFMIQIATILWGD